jgi:ActR/RegA family two-component response regulator
MMQLRIATVSRRNTREFACGAAFIDCGLKRPVHQYFFIPIPRNFTRSHFRPDASSMRLRWALRATSIRTCIEPMGKADCVLLADPHHGLSEGVRGLLATAFQTVVMVADEGSLFESASRLHSDLAVVDLALSGGNGLELVRRLRDRFAEMKLIILSIHDYSVLGRSVLEAGADGFVVKRAIATDLLAAIDAVLAGQEYVSPAIGQTQAGQSS